MCGTAPRDGDRLCRLCGEELAGGQAVTGSFTPPPPAADPAGTAETDVPPSPWSRPWYAQRQFQAVGAGLLLLVLVLSIGLTLSRGGDAAPSSDAGAVGEHTTTDDVWTEEPYTEEPYTEEPYTEDPYTATTPELSADEQATLDLDALADEGLSGADEVYGTWLAQLSSKAPGVQDEYQTTADGSHVFGAADIRAQVQELSARSDLGRIIVLRSTDYGERQTYQGQAMWVVFSDNGFGSKKEVRAWCREHFDGTGAELENACIPRRPSP
ncbi:hypothetical protein LR393_34095 [Kineosporia mesophila]|uniref:hypothetical protein n=1 Tax=Kineosporia mesophila TaxID=566012 RepID=UPI001E4D338B|nr:hypothetical protein [Kineosporia mesophila]MCD5355125.1 hypothetical protein [Kineosporia mesophila]